MSTCIFSHFISDKEAEKYTLERRKHLQQIVRENGMSTCRVKWDPCLPPLTTAYLKWIEDLSVKPETLALAKDELGGTLCDTGEGLPHQDSITQESRPTADKWDFTKLKRFATTRETANWVKKKPKEMGEDFHQRYIWQRINVQHI